MTALVSFLAFCQALGALIGAFTAIWSELAYIRAIRDGKIDAAERAHLRLVGKGLSFGMTLLLLASFALVVVNFTLQATLQPALSTSYWSSIFLAFLIIGVSWALSRHRISFALGSAILFTAWWFLTYLTFGLLPLPSFGATVAFFVVATGIFYALLQYARLLALDSTMKHRLAQKVKSL
ncbi:hypothetical protein HY415_01770 [Candidatus Kaiserbacteria bacterium]|nr:hypothetical protein [Candidatus Kaiserbacteria bacterium]